MSGRTVYMRTKTPPVIGRWQVISLLALHRVFYGASNRSVGRKITGKEPPSVAGMIIIFMC